MKKVLSKDEFCKYLNNIIEREKNAEILSKALQTYANDKEFTGFIENSEFEISFLENLLDDENHWISWWFYEARENPNDLFCECNGKKWIIKNPEELYDFLFQEETKKENEYFKGGKFCLDKINEMIKKAEETKNCREFIEYLKAINDDSYELRNEDFESLEEQLKLLKFVRTKIKNELFAKTGIYFLEKDDY